MKTTSHITIIAALIALLVPATVSANVYEDRLKEAFDNITNAVPLEDLSQMHTIYSDPETGVKEGQLDVYKFTIDSEDMGLINDAKRVYEQVNGNSSADIYTLWWNDNDDGTFQATACITALKMPSRWAWTVTTAILWALSPPMTRNTARPTPSSGVKTLTTASVVESSPPMLLSSPK